MFGNASFLIAYKSMTYGLLPVIIITGNSVSCSFDVPRRLGRSVVPAYAPLVKYRTPKKFKLVKNNGSAKNYTSVKNCRTYKLMQQPSYIDKKTPAPTSLFDKRPQSALCSAAWPTTENRNHD